MNRHGMRWPSSSATIAAAFAALLLVISGAALAAGDVAAVPWPTTGWEASTPEAQGVASSALADLVEFGAKSEMDSLLVVRHGRIVTEAYYAPFRPGMRHLVNSVTKAVVGTLAGIAVQRGEIASVDEPVLESFPWRAVANAEGTKAQLKIAHLLDMTSGLDWNEPLTSAPPETMLEMARSRDWVGFVLDRPMAHAPGTAFNYNSGDWHLVSAILARKTWLDTFEYARRTLFAPLGIADATWRADPQGVRSGGFGLSLQPRDMAKIGYLYLRRGEWDGRQLLPREWVDKVFDPQVEMHVGTYRYANGWWTIPQKRAHMAVGFLRQLIVVLPDIDTVAVVTGGRRNYAFPQLIDRVVAAAKSPLPLPADPAAAARLAERIAAAGVETASAVMPVSTIASTVSGKTYRLDANWTGITSIKLDLTSPSPRYETTFAPIGRGGSVRHIEGPIGLDGSFRLREPQGSEPLLAVKGTWLSENSFQLISRSLLEGVLTTYVLTFDGPQLDIAVEDNRGVRLRMHGLAVD